MNITIWRDDKDTKAAKKCHHDHECNELNYQCAHFNTRKLGLVGEFFGLCGPRYCLQVSDCTQIKVNVNAEFIDYLEADGCHNSHCFYNPNPKHIQCTDNNKC